MRVVAVTAVLAGADTFIEIEAWYHEKRVGLPQYLKRGIGVASHNISADCSRPSAQTRLRLTESDITPEVRPTKGALTLIAKIDGSIIPRVQTGKSDECAPQDRRKIRKVLWKEGQLSMI
jgi:hypothetical protein